MEHFNIVEWNGTRVEVSGAENILVDQPQIFSIANHTIRLLRSLSHYPVHFTWFSTQLGSQKHF